MKGERHAQVEVQQKAQNYKIACVLHPFVLQTKHGTGAAMRATEPNPTATGNTAPKFAKASALPKRS